MLVTVTVTRGSLTNFFSFSLMSADNCMGVNPAACTSFNSGKEILPSGRTGTGPDNSCSFQTLIFSWSSGPITYLGSSVTAFGSAAAVATGAAACAQTDAANTSIKNVPE